MSLIEQKEMELKKLKKEEQDNKWGAYLEKMKIFLDKLKGKTLMSWTSNGQFYMCKVLGYKEKYYVNGSGFNGQWNRKRWFELETTGYLNFRVPYWDGKIFKQAPPSITENVWFNDIHVPYQCHRLVVTKGKKKNNIIFPKFVMSDAQMIESCSGEINNIVTIGKLAHDENTPDYDKSFRDFVGFKKIIEGDMFEEALRIHEEHTLKTLEFYKKFEDKFKNNPNNYIGDDFYKIKLK